VSSSDSLALAAIGLSSVNCLLLLLTFIRAGRWKDGDDARELIARVTSAESKIAGIEADMRNVATKADVAGLGERVAGVESHLKSIERGVERIESHLMRTAA
jgi:hypothetical protein